MFEITLRDGVVVAGSYDKKGQPVVIVKNVPRIPGSHTFNAAQFIDADRRGKDFRFGTGFACPYVGDGLVDYVLSADTVHCISSLVLNSYNKQHGHFAVMFVNTLGLPF